MNGIDSPRCCTASVARAVPRRMAAVGLLVAVLVGGPRRVALGNPESDVASNPRPAEARRLSFDFDQLARDVRDRGIDAVLADLEPAAAAASDRRLVSALDHLRDVLREHPEQLWFQLDAHTRLQGWEDIREQLAENRPGEMLVAKTSSLPGPRPGVLRTWRFGEQPLSFLGLSADGTELYCGTFMFDPAQAEFVAIDPQTHQVIRRRKVSGRVLGTAPGPDGSDYVIINELERTDFFPSVRDARSNREIVRSKGKIDSVHWGFGVLGEITPPVQTSAGGEHLIFWSGSSFVSRDLSNWQKAFWFQSRTEPTKLTPLLIEFLDPQRLISLDIGGYVRLFAYPGGQELFPPRQIISRPGAYALSPDRSRMAVSGLAVPDAPRQARPENAAQTVEEVILIWDIARREEVARFRLPAVPSKDFRNEVTSLALQGNETLVSGRRSGEIQRWRIGSDDAISTVAAHGEPVLFVVPSADEGHAFTADVYGRLKLVDLASTDAWLEPLPPDDTRPFRRVVSREGHWEAGYASGVVSIWESASGRRLHRLEMPKELVQQLGSVTSIGIDLEARQVILGGEERIGQWKFDSGETESVEVDLRGFQRREVRRSELQSEIERVRIHVAPDGQHAVAWQSRQLAAFDPQTGQRRFLISPAAYLGDVHHFLDDGRLALTARESGRAGVRVFELGRGQVVATHEHGEFQGGVTFAAQAGLLLTGGKCGAASVREPHTLAVWKPGTPAEFFDLPDDVRVSKIGVSSDASRAITSSSDGTLLLWDLPRKEVLRRFDLRLHPNRHIHALAFDGQTLVLTEDDEHTRHVFEYVSDPAVAER